MRALIAICLLAGVAHAELPTIDSELPPALRIESTSWSARIDSVTVELHSAPETSFVKIAIGGREGTQGISIDVPAGTKVVGLGVDGVDGAVWGRAMPVDHAQHRQGSIGGSALTWSSTSAEQDHLWLRLNVPATVELALYLPPLPRLAIASTAGLLAVEVEGERVPTNKHRRVVVELADIAGTTGEVQLAAVTETVGLVAAPSSPLDFFQPVASFGGTRGVHMTRDLDKAMIRRRMKWFRPGLRQCFVQAAQWGPHARSLRGGGAVLSFMILPEGTVEWARASESDLPASVNTCLEETVKTWEFPEADSRVQVNYPLTFQTYEW